MSESINPIATEQEPQLELTCLQRWTQIASQVDEVTDRLGKPIDTGIKRTVIGLQAHNINTMQSCEGHMEWGTAAPWVEIGGTGVPALEAHLFKKSRKLEEAEARYVYPEEVERLHVEVETLRKQIIVENLTERSKAIVLLRNFYENRQVPYDRLLILQSYGLSRTRIESLGASLQIMASQEVKKQKLREFQTEMDMFAQFLRDEYFSDNLADE